MNSSSKVAAVVVERLPLSQLKPHPRNPRVHPEPGTEEWEKLRASLADAYFDPIVWNRTNGLLVSGHLRRKILQADGFTAADVVVVEWDEHRHLARMIAANQSAGKDDRGELGVILDELNLAGFNLALTGLLDVDLAKLLPTAPEPEPVSPIETEEAAPPITQRGDIYYLGAHRLACGDSSQAPEVHRLLAGDVVDQVITDPPYGVDYVEKSRAMSAAMGGEGAGANHRPIINDDLADYRRFFGAFLSAIPLAPKNTLFIFMSGQELHNVRLAFDDAQITWGDYLVWVKNGQVMGRKDYHPKHEFVVYGWRGAHRFYGGVSAAVIDDETPPAKMSKAALVEEVERLRDFRRTVLREDKPLVNDLHPTMKPVNLVRRLLLDGSLPGHVVYDAFNGSGTTLLACDLVERRYRGMELEPVHCDTTVRRWLAQGAGRRVQRQRPVEDEAGNVVTYVTEDVTALFTPAP